MPSPGPVELVFGDTGAPEEPAAPLRGVHLVFTRPPVASPGPVRLVFGDDDAPAPVIPDATLHGSGTLTGLRLHFTARAGVRVSGGGTITGLRLHIAARYDINVQRPTVGRTRGRWQDATPVQSAVRSTWQQSATLGAATRSRWQDGTTMPAATLARWRDTLRASRAARSAFQQALRTPSAPVRSSFAQALFLRAVAGGRFQEALRAPALPVGIRFQETYRRQARVRSTFEGAARVGAGWASGMGIALRLQRAWGGGFQQAWPPRPGQWQWPGPDVPHDPCYLPALPAQLVFSQPHDANLPARLVFICERHGPGPQPGETVVVPVRRVYMVSNSVTLHRLDTGAPLRAITFSMSLEEGSWMWSWDASLHMSAADHLGRDSNGDPPVLAVAVNGVEFRLLLEERSKDERFLPEVRFKVAGSGLAASLDGPAAPTMNFGNNAARTAQQLAADVLTVNGAPMGWAVDWGLEDWLVPAKAWTFQGTYIEAINDIATAAGGYVQPHNTDPVLRILPRYPTVPWEWDSITPNLVIPRAAAEVVSTEYVDKPRYNQVHVGGVAAGVFGPWKRAGTPGDKEAPQVTHALITHADAQRQRARSVLSDTGSQALVSLSMQVRPETGIVMPGKFVRYQGNEDAIGIVRGVSLNWDRPKLRQVIRLETHA